MRAEDVEAAVDQLVALVHYGADDNRSWREYATAFCGVRGYWVTDRAGWCTKDGGRVVTERAWDPKNTQVCSYCENTVQARQVRRDAGQL